MTRRGLSLPSRSARLFGVVLGCALASGVAVSAWSAADDFSARALAGAPFLPVFERASR